MVKGTTVFQAMLQSDTPVETEPLLEPGFEPFYWTCEDNRIRLAGWEKQVFFPIGEKTYPLMSIRIEREIYRPSTYRAVVDFSWAIRYIGSSLTMPQDIIEVFPLDWVKHGNGHRIEGDWKDNPYDVFDDVDVDASLVVRKILDAVDKRHVRMMPVFDIYAAVQACVSNRRQDDGTIVREQLPAHVEKLVERVQGDDFRDAVERWARARGSRIGTSMDGVFYNGNRCFPSKEQAESWLVESVNPEGPMFVVKEEPKE